MWFWRMKNLKLTSMAFLNKLGEEQLLQDPMVPPDVLEMFPDQKRVARPSTGDNFLLRNYHVRARVVPFQFLKDRDATVPSGAICLEPSSALMSKIGA